MTAPTERLLDDKTEIAIDNALWDYAGFIHSPATEHGAREKAYDASRDALRSRIRTLIEEARKDAMRKMAEELTR